MGIFQKIFGAPRQPRAQGIFRTLVGYTPAFTTWDGQMYESELVRAAIDARARHISKLGITVNGQANQKLRSSTRRGPSTWQTWGQFLYRTSTILDVKSTVFVVPVTDRFGDHIGYAPVMPTDVDLVDVHGDPWIRYRFGSGEVAAVPLVECAVLTKFQYKDDLFGTGNEALQATMNLLSMQKQGIEEGIKNSATFRFMATVTNFLRREDLKAERQRFNEDNLQDGSGGILLMPNEYKDVKQITQEQYKVDADQMKLIQTNVFNYFGVNEDILQNKAFGDSWAAFYEGAIEPFAIQLSDTMTRMTFSQREIAAGNEIFFTSNRLQYLTNNEKLQVSKELVDRGVFNRDEVREIWNLPPLPDGQGSAYIIRGEYKDAEDHLKEEKDDAGNA